MTPVRALLFRGAAGAIGLLLALAGVELGCRLLADRLLDLRHPTVVFDPELGWVQRPGVRDTRTNEAGQTVAIEGSDGGIRARPGDPPRPGGVLVLGDSFVAGTQVPYDDTWVAGLESRLRRHHPGLDVVNAGVDRYDLAQAYRMMERLSPRLRPRHVVVAVYLGNDVLDYGCCARARPPWEPSTPRSWLREHSYAYHVAAGSARRMFGGRAVEDGEEAPAEPAWSPRSVPEFGSLRPDQQARILGQFASADLLPALREGPEGARRLESVRRMLDAFARTAGEGCAGLTVLVLPTKQQVIPVQRQEWMALHGLAVEDVARPALKLVEGGGRSGVRVVDLTVALAAVPEPETLFWRVDLHWSNAGHARVAEVVSPIVEENLASAPTECGS